MTNNDLPYRVCDLCGGVDQDPRHSFTGVIPDVHPVNDAVRSDLDANLERLTSDGSLSFSDALAVGQAFSDTTSTDRHIDCCAQAGCPKAGTPDGCDLRVEAANGETGEGMREAAMSLKKES